MHLTETRVRLKEETARKPLAVAAGMAAAGMGLPIPGSFFFFWHIRGRE